jgi:SAM-dependent methyltransferase
VSKGYPDETEDRLIARLVRLWKEPQDYLLIAKAIQKLDRRYGLYQKMGKEPGVVEIVEQMAGRLAASYTVLSNLRGKRILDIACGSSTSKLPASLHVNTPFGEMTLGEHRGYTALFEPWFCRILVELGAAPVGVDFGNLDKEVFEHYHVDLGKPGALGFFAGASFDGIQDSRLFGSPEFTAQFPKLLDRLRMAQEIVKQEKRLLKPGGIMIHSDAKELLQ